MLVAHRRFGTEWYMRVARGRSRRRISSRSASRRNGSEADAGVTHSRSIHARPEIQSMDLAIRTTAGADRRGVVAVGLTEKRTDAHANVRSGTGCRRRGRGSVRSGGGKHPHN